MSRVNGIDGLALRCDLTPTEAREAAHALLVKIGFELQYISAGGSWYYQLPGRKGGLLRLSDHAKKNEGHAGALTIHSLCVPHNINVAVARAVGHYMIKTSPE